MNKVILITGASSGIGKETVRLFQSKEWKVAATMRSPEKEEDLKNVVDVSCIPLDVTNPDTIKSAIEETLEKFGRIDAVVNNAGYSVVGPFEASTDQQMRDQFETNVFGLMNVCRGIIPYFREQKRGTIVNVASMGGRITFPFYSLYHATKWAVEGFSESLQYELRPFGIKIKIVEPGPIRTDFYDRSMTHARNENLHQYDPMLEKAIPNMEKSGADAPGPELVAEAIYTAVNDGSWKMRYSPNARMVLALRRVLPDWAFFRVVRSAVFR
ncbi:MAG: SDR family oxidoreductase [Acidobacteriota bacterium]|nr:MAG: SDR family oxidoreductase [Acidobacteriota bacterium]